MKKNDNKFEELVSKINELKLADEQKEIIIRYINDLEIDFNRLKKSTDMQIEELNIEKEILLDNYIKKDKDADYLYNKIQEIEKSKIWKLSQKISNVKNRVINIWKRKK